MAPVRSDRSCDQSLFRMVSVRIEFNGSLGLGHVGLHEYLSLEWSSRGVHRDARLLFDPRHRVSAVDSCSRMFSGELLESAKCDRMGFLRLFHRQHLGNAQRSFLWADLDSLVHCVCRCGVMATWGSRIFNDRRRVYRSIWSTWPKSKIEKSGNSGRRQSRAGRERDKGKLWKSANAVLSHEKFRNCI